MLGEKRNRCELSGRVQQAYISVIKDYWRYQYMMPSIFSTNIIKAAASWSVVLQRAELISDVV